jgi:hypothetical protein
MGYSTMVFAGGVFGKTIIQGGKAAALCKGGQDSILLIKLLDDSGTYPFECPSSSSKRSRKRCRIYRRVRVQSPS